MPLSIDQLFTAPTSDQIRAQMVSTLVTLGVPADKWRAGGVASSMLTAVAIAIALLGSLMSTIIQGFFLPTATGGGLELLAYYVYGVTVPAATFATGNVTLTNAGGGIFPMGVGEYICLNSTTNQTYANTTAFTLGANATLSIEVRAVNAGSVGNAAPGAINTSVTTLIGVTVTNPASLVGVDRLTDAAIRQLCLDSLGARSVYGPRTAYAYAIETAVNSVTLAPVNINRWSILADSHTGIVTVYVASPSGAPSATDVTGVGTNIEAIARPEAVTVALSGATAVVYNPTITIWVTASSGTTAAQIQTAADNAVVDYIKNFPIGGVQIGAFAGLYGVGVVGAIEAAVIPLGAKLINATGQTNLSLGASEVATDSVTIVVRIVTVSA